MVVVFQPPHLLLWILAITPVPIYLSIDDTFFTHMHIRRWTPSQVRKRRSRAGVIIIIVPTFLPPYYSTDAVHVHYFFFIFSIHHLKRKSHIQILSSASQREMPPTNQPTNQPLHDSIRSKSKILPLSWYVYTRERPYVSSSSKGSKGPFPQPASQLCFASFLEER